MSLILRTLWAGTTEPPPSAVPRRAWGRGAAPAARVKALEPVVRARGNAVTLPPRGLMSVLPPARARPMHLGEGAGTWMHAGRTPSVIERAHTCAEENDRTPRHDMFLGIRVGEASNPGPAPLGPWEPDPAFTSQFATFGEGWVAFVYLGVLDRDGSPSLSFKAGAPLGSKVATFHVLGERHLFCGLITGRAYVCAEARPVMPNWEGAHEFHVGHPGSQTAVVSIRMAPSGLAWSTEDPERQGGPWTHADLACGIGGFTIAAHALGATTTWACDVNRTAVEAYSAAHSRGHACPAECHPIEQRARWSRHVGTDVISAGFPCQAFNRVSHRQGYRDARGQVIFHLIQLCWVLRPRFMVLECVWPFFENPMWVEPVCEYFRGMGYGVSIRKE